MIEYIFLLFIICAFLMPSPTSWGKPVAKMLPLVLGAGFLYYLTALNDTTVFVAQEFELNWIPSLGVNLSFKLDALALFFSLLITLIGMTVFLYADGYLKTRKKIFSTTLLFFTASMLGLVQANNLIIFFIFWELTSISSFMLIAHKNEKAEAKDSSRTALFITVGGGLCLLVGFTILSSIAQQLGLSLEQSLSFSDLANIDITSHSLTPLAFIFILLGVATKSAQFPFHFWLPLAMSGPAPVSSFLHSATMVKAGVFLLLRIFPIFSGYALWTPILVVMGGVTMLIGAILCISQTDLKRVLAYSTISALGALVMLIGHGTEQALKAALAFLLAHAFYKASLFQVAGNLELSSGNKSLNDLYAMKKILPLSAMAAALSVLSFIGIPPLVGFYGKELTYLLGLSSSDLGSFILIMSFFSFLFMGVMAISLAIFPFWKKSSFSGINLNPKKLSLSSELPPVFLALLGLIFGLAPFLFTKSVGEALIQDLVANPEVYKLKLWHGFDKISLIALGLSGLTISLGAFGAYKVQLVHRQFERLTPFYARFDFRNVFDQALLKILVLSKFTTRVFQNGSLISYVRTVLFGVILIIIVPMFKLIMSGQAQVMELSTLEFIIVFITCAPLILALREAVRLQQIIFLALSGFGIIILFSFYSAIDLAITQLVVEALSIIFVLVLLYKLPQQSDKRPKSIIDIILSILFSVSIFFLIIFRHIPQTLDVSQYYIKNSLSEAFGRNIVNVILVDFRSLDTFGEIIVVAIAAIGVSVLLKSKKSESNDV